MNTQIEKVSIDQVQQYASQSGKKCAVSLLERMKEMNWGFIPKRDYEVVVEQKECSKCHQTLNASAKEGDMCRSCERDKRLQTEREAELVLWNNLAKQIAAMNATVNKVDVIGGQSHNTSMKVYFEGIKDEFTISKRWGNKDKFTVCLGWEHQDKTQLWFGDKDLALKLLKKMGKLCDNLKAKQQNEKSKQNAEQIFAMKMETLFGKVSIENVMRSDHRGRYVVTGAKKVTVDGFYPTTYDGNVFNLNLPNLTAEQTKELMKWYKENVKVKS